MEFTYYSLEGIQWQNMPKDSVYHLCLEKVQPELPGP